MICDVRLQRLELILVSYDATCASARISPQPAILGFDRDCVARHYG